MVTSSVVVIANQRSGTNLLRRTLASNPHFKDHREIFRPVPCRSNKELLLSLLLERLGKSHQAYYKSFWEFKKTRLWLHPELTAPKPNHTRRLFNLYLNELTKGKEVISIFDVKYSSTHCVNPAHHHHILSTPPFLFKLLAEANIPVIHLVRRNSFENYVSFKIADSTGIWISQRGQKAQPIQIEIDPVDMIKGIQKRQDEINLYRRWLTEVEPLRVLELSYETLLDKEKKFSDIVRAKIFNFLGVDEDLGLEIKTRKIVSKPLEEVITNYDAVVRTLMAEGFSQFLPNQREKVLVG